MDRAKICAARRRLAGFAALCLTTTATASAWAASPAESGVGAQGELIGYILLGTSLLLAAGMVGVYWYIRRQRRTSDEFDFELFSQQAPSSYDTRPRTARSKTRSVDSNPEPASVGADTVLEALGETGMDFASSHSGPQRECPDCSRLFPPSIVVCPYDSTPLRRAMSRKRRRKRSRGEHPLDRMVCTGCERRYEPGVEYCYHDGLPLMRDTLERASDAPAFKACRSCGWEGEADELTCPVDGEELVEIDASDSTQVQPTIPMMVCSQCGQYGAPGKAFCPNDGEMLTPMLNARMTEFPERGFGPRRKICKSCGQQHSGAARYCSSDGTKLMSLN